MPALLPPADWWAPATAEPEPPAPIEAKLQAFIDSALAAASDADGLTWTDVSKMTGQFISLAVDVAAEWSAGGTAKKKLVMAAATALFTALSGFLPLYLRAILTVVWPLVWPFIESWIDGQIEAVYAKTKADKAEVMAMRGAPRATEVIA